jgi:hypothetical protein
MGKLIRARLRLVPGNNDGFLSDSRLLTAGLNRL